MNCSVIILIVCALLISLLASFQFNQKKHGDIHNGASPGDSLRTCKVGYMAVPEGCGLVNKKPLLIPKGVKLSAYMITLPQDQWKRDRFKQSMDTHGQEIQYKQWEGVIVQDKPELLNWALKNKLGHVKNKKLKGNIGSALAHITLWDFVAKRDDSEHFLIFEDNATVTEMSHTAFWDVHNLDYDMIYLRALRATGEPTNIPGVLRVTYMPSWADEPNNLAPNIWLSSYLLKPRGARQLLQYFKEYNFDLSGTIIDRAISKAISLDATQRMKVFVVDHKKYFGHVQTKGDTRLRQNGGK